MTIEQMYYLVGILTPVIMILIALFGFCKKTIVRKIKKCVKKIVENEIKEQRQESN